ncbi:MAG: hypothetical protein Q8N35_13910 [Methylococcaceae bacterium]|nr:hypothetical protein [Methylococcaceae bacterium]MDP3020676.1 hypothetical protein [Methylococcaceae bacterium]
MQPEIFISYKDAAIHTYADESVAAARWPKKDALVLSKASFETLLPKGLETANHYIYEIQDENINNTNHNKFTCYPFSNGRRLG